MPHKRQKPVDKRVLVDIIVAAKKEKARILEEEYGLPPEELEEGGVCLTVPELMKKV